MVCDKYLEYNYTSEIKDILANTNMSIEDKVLVAELNNLHKNKPYYYIIKDLYKLCVKNNYSTSSLCQIYDIQIRNAQLWVKDLGFNEHVKNGKKINIQEDNNNCIAADLKNDILDNNFCLYRFLDEDKRVLYIGKCEKSQHSNGHGGIKEYFIKDRIIQHYSPSSKHNPKSLYLNTRYIEICFPSVECGQELEKVESEIVSYYERIKKECFYNKDLASGTEYISQDNLDWKIYETKTDRDINILLKKYKIKSIPQIEITNERLKSILWCLNM